MNYGSAQRSAVTKALWKNPEARRRRVAGLRKAMLDPRERTARKLRSEKKWKDIFYRDNVRKGLRRAWKSLTYEERCSRVASFVKSRWNTPEQHEKHSLAIKDFWKRAKSAGNSPRRIGNSGQNWSRCKRSWLNSKKAGIIFCRSSWENRYAKELDKNSQVLSFFVEPCLIWVPALKKFYKPDFLVVYKNMAISLVEVKPKSLLNDATVRTKITAARKHCKYLGFRFAVVSYG